MPMECVSSAAACVSSPDRWKRGIGGDVKSSLTRMFSYVEAAFQRAFCAVNGLSADVKNLELCNITGGELCFRNFVGFFAEQRLADRGFIGDDVLVGVSFGGALRRSAQKNPELSF